MSIINKVANDALRENMLRAQMSNTSYNAVNGKRQATRDFREGMLNMGKLDSQMDAPTEKITKEMIMDYKREQEETPFFKKQTRMVEKTRIVKRPTYDSAGLVIKNFTGVPILQDVEEKYLVAEQYDAPTVYQQTGMKTELEDYRVPFAPKDVDKPEQERKYRNFIAMKIKYLEEYKQLEEEEKRLTKEMMETELKASLFSVPIATKLLVINDLKKKINEVQMQKKLKLADIEVSDDIIKNQETVLAKMDDNIKANALSIAQTDSRNKEYIKNYAEKFNILNRNKLGVDKQPHETEEQYFYRIVDLERTAFDPNIYKDKAAISENRKFKKNLAEIIKDPAKIENINKSFPAPEDVYSINNNWSKISNFLKNKYGINNKFTTEKEYIDEINEALKNIRSSTFNVSQITKNKPTPKNDTLIITNLAGANLYIKIWQDKDANQNIYYSSNPNNSYQKLVYKDINNIFRDFNISSFGVHTTLKKLYKNLSEKINVSIEDPRKLRGTAPIVGTGIKRGRGMQQIEENEEANHTAEEIPKISDFGNKKILLNKLYYRNVLSVKDKKGHSIEKLPNTVVSDDFVKIIMMLSDNKKPSIEAMTIRDNLEDSEKELLSLLLFITGINKNKNIDISKVENVKKLKNRLNLVEAQIVAGNNNPEVKKEMKQIINKLYLYGAISYNHAKEYIKQF